MTLPQERKITEYSFDMGVIAAIDAANASAATVIPFAGELMSAALHVDKTLATAGGANQTFSVFVNGSDSGVVFSTPDGLLAANGILMFLDARLQVNKGDRIHLVSGAEQATVTTAGFLSITVNANEAVNLNHRFLDAGLMSDIGAIGNLSNIVVMPEVGRIVGAFVHNRTLTTAKTTFDILKNGVELSAHVPAAGSDADFVLPNAAPANKGQFCRIDNATGIPVAIGDTIRMQSNGETGPSIADVILILETGSGDLSRYSIPAGLFSAIQTAGNLSTAVVVPEDGQLVGAVLNAHTVICATPVTFDVLKNTADSNLDVQLPAAVVDERGSFCRPLRDTGDDSYLEVVAGDLIQLRSNGEQAAATAADGALIFRR